MTEIETDSGFECQKCGKKHKSAVWVNQNGSVIALCLDCYERRVQQDEDIGVRSKS